MSQYPKMLYKVGGPNAEEMHGGRFGTLIVQDVEHEADALKSGWRLTTSEATDFEPAEVDADAPPTRAELEVQATALDIAFDARWGDKKLAAAIEKAMAPD